MITALSNFLLVGAPTWFGPVFVVASGSEAEGGHGGIPHLPNFIGFIEELVGGHILSYWINNIFALIISIILAIVAVRVYARREMIPGRFQNFIEVLVEGIYNFISSILGGNEAKRYTPFLGTLFFYILISNWMGMVPLGHSPSTSLNFTGALAIIVFFYVQYIGISRLGFGKYIHHLAGSPSDVITWCMVPLMLPLHIIGELARPMSLALRLFGNITGEDVLIAVFVGLGISILAFSPVGLPLQTPFYFLGLLLSTVQALVFTLLSTIYILLMLPHEEH